MDVTEVLTKKTQEHIGFLTFEMLKKDALIEMLENENGTLKQALLAQEKKEQ